MIPSLPTARCGCALRDRAVYVVAFLLFLFLPLVVVAVFAFNDAHLPGAALARLHARLVRGRCGHGRVGLFADAPLLEQHLDQRAWSPAG